MSELRPPTGRVSLRCPHHPSSVPCPIPRRTEQVPVSITSLFVQPSPGKRRVGVRIDCFEACSDFTRVMARWIAQPPMAAFVTRLQSGRSLVQTARQLPDQSTTLWVESSSTSDTRHRGALLPPSPAAVLAAANLAPASGRQDHTTSPSASVPFVKGTSASTASRPAFRDDRERPSCRVETGRACSGDLPDGLSGIFFS
jgi:hypothetical protein